MLFRKQHQQILRRRRHALITQSKLEYSVSYCRRTKSGRFIVDLVCEQFPSTFSARSLSHLFVHLILSTHFCFFVLSGVIAEAELLVATAMIDDIEELSQSQAFTLYFGTTLGNRAYT